MKPLKFLSASISLSVMFATPAMASDQKSVLENYANIALAKYEDSLTTANTLKQAIDTLTSSPNEANLKAARQAWLAARVPAQLGMWLS